MKKYILVLIILTAALLRLWKLGSIPPSLTPDEAALGYNAYSILMTGRDEYGQLLPIIFKSFGDYKPGLYVYFTVPSIAILGLTEFATRLPSAIAGILAVILIYKIVLEFCELDKRILPTTSNKLQAIIASFLLAVSPWHIQFSRGAWEANLSLTLTLAGIYFFLLSVKRHKYLPVSAIFFGLTLITYQGAKLSTFIVVFILVVVFWREFMVLINDKKIVVISVVLGLFITTPILLSLFGGKTGRLTVFSVFSYPRPPDYLQNFLNEDNEKVGTLTYYLFHSETLNFARGVIGRWFNHFSGRFLFFEGDYQNPNHSAPNQGMLLLTDLVLIPIGLYGLIKKRGKFVQFIFLWLILSPLPAALSRDQVHAVRALNMVIPFTFVSSAGLVELIDYLRSISEKRFLLVSYIFLLTSVFTACFVYYLDAYFVHLPVHGSQLWDYGYREVVRTVIPIQGNYKTIKVQQSFAQPYIYFLFYGSQMDSQKYGPAKYQKGAHLTESEYKGDVGYVTKLDNIEFVPIDWSVDRGDHGDLVVGDPVRIPPYDSNNTEQFKLVGDIKYLNGEEAFRIIEVK